MRLALLLALLAAPAQGREATGLPPGAGPLLDFALPADPRCAGADDRVLCLSDLAEASRAAVVAALAKVRQGIETDTDYPEMDAAAKREAIATVERSQGAWVAAVDARCTDEVAIAFRGGTGRNEASMLCYLAHDARRLAELTDLAP